MWYEKIIPFHVNGANVRGYFMKTHDIQGF